jgi:hypothetical protein
MGEEGKQQRISDNFYVRGDGTCAFYFSHGDLKDMFQVRGYRGAHFIYDVRHF